MPHSHIVVLFNKLFPLGLLLPNTIPTASGFYLTYTSEQPSEVDNVIMNLQMKNRLREVQEVISGTPGVQTWWRGSG